MNQLSRFLLLLPAIAAVNYFASATPAQNHPNHRNLATMTKSSQPFNYDQYGTVLQTYVNSQGLVNYQQLQANRQSLDAF